ncbi:MAG TPA: hypothetical protein VGP13_02015 [Candidatus Paceibacterota bacterium]|jgi:hypothetical protein|nr:hypothetical protein [Candidatus Paceibacterota bacterium]
MTDFSFRSSGAFVENIVALADVSAPALDASLGNLFYLNTQGNRTIAPPTNSMDGQKVIIRVTAIGGDRTLALSSSAGGFRFGTDIMGLTATTEDTSDYIGCIYNASAGFWDVVAYTKGF